MRPRIAVIADSPDEGWPSMDLLSEMLVREWRGDLAGEVEAEKVEWDLPKVARRASSKVGAFSIDRVLGRFARYPAHAAALRARFHFFHVADHSYAQVLHALPRDRTGVYCHDLDTFRSVLEPENEPRSRAFRAMMHVVLAGLRRARLVFHSTREMGKHLARVVPRARLVYAPYGIGAEFKPDFDPDDGADDLLASLKGAPFALHVGSAIPRKRLDVLFDVFAKLRAKMPSLRFVQLGGDWNDAQNAQVDRLGIRDFILRPAKLAARVPADRIKLAGLYRRAGAVLMTSDAEGFGIPVLESLACGAPVIASEIPTMREAGGDPARYVPVGDVDGFVRATLDALAHRSDAKLRDARVAHAKKFSWHAHARTILDAYLSLEDA